MKIIKESQKNKFVLKFVFDNKLPNNFIVKKNYEFTEDINNEVVFMYLGKVDEVKKLSIQQIASTIVANQRRELQIDIETAGSLDHIELIKALLIEDGMKNSKIYNAKSDKKDDVVRHSIIAKENDEIKKYQILAESMTYTRNWQITPPNFKRSDAYAEQIAKDLASFKNLSVKVLNKKEIESLGMGLLLSVNKGSAFEPRVVVIEYNGNKNSKDKTVYVGKGIVYDAGGVNIKTGNNLNGMKYDMSGSAIVVGTMMSISKLEPQTNVSGVLVITDNVINSHASTPDSVWTSMNGKTVEINNTDAEGRLALADGITYAIRKLHATRIVDVATLTGAIIMALGSTYSGVWATTEEAWQDIEAAAKKANELIWRMPLHEDFLKFMKGSKVADLKNTDLSGKGGGSSSAAMFLKEFTEDVEYIHIDIAGTADVDHAPKGVMVRTLTELALK